MAKIKSEVQDHVKSEVQEHIKSEVEDRESGDDPLVPETEEEGGYRKARNYSCPMCPKKWAYPWELRRHVISHYKQVREVSILGVPAACRGRAFVCLV